MPAPTSYPAWLSKPGAEDTMVLDANGYNAAASQGYQNTGTTPSAVSSAPSTAAPSAPTVTVSRVAKTSGQADAVFDTAKIRKR